MYSHLVMTIIAQDRPGVVEAVSGVIEDHGGNWLESQMARLAGKFAGILRIAVDTARADEMVAALNALNGAGLHVRIERSDGVPVLGEVHAVSLGLIGHDRPGIVHHITEVLAALGVNIAELSTTLTSTPMSGGPLFTANAHLQVPKGVALEVLRQQLETIAADLMVDISLCDEEDRA